jgi:hypothetical protein
MENMNTRSMVILIAVVSVGLCIAGVVHSDETWKFRAVMYAPSAQFTDFGYVDGHATRLVRLSGLASLGDGGTSNVVGITNYNARFRAHSLLAL